MSAAEQQSLNAVKAALQNAQARSEGSVARGRGEQPFVCATVGLRIEDLKSVVSIAARALQPLTGLEPLGASLLETADDLAKVTAQRDELTASVERLTATCNALTDRVKVLEVERNDLAEIEEQCQRIIDRATGADPQTTSMETLDTRLAFLVAELVGERNRIVALQEALAAEKTAHLATIKNAEYLRAELEPCEVHHGARRACGQCLSSTQQHLKNVATERDELRTEVGLWRVVTESAPTGTPADYVQGREKFLDSITSRLLKDGEIAIRKDDYERLIASLPAGPRAVK